MVVCMCNLQINFLVVIGVVMVVVGDCSCWLLFSALLGGHSIIWLFSACSGVTGVGCWSK